MCVKLPAVFSALVILLLSALSFAEGSVRFERLALAAVQDQGGGAISAVRAVVKGPQGFIWLGSENGVFRYDGRSLVGYHAQSGNDATLSGNFVWDLAVDQDGTLWVATGNGLNIYRPDTNHFEHFTLQTAETSLTGESIFTLAVDAQNRLYLGTSNGLLVLGPQREQLTRYRHSESQADSLSRDHVRDVFVDSANRVWVATAGGGLNRLQRESGGFVVYRHRDDDPNSLIDDDVSAITEDHAGQIWAGSYSSGLTRFDPASWRFWRYSRSEDKYSLASNNVADLLTDSGGRVWVATDHGGLALYRPQTNDFQRFTHSAYDSDSLSSDQPRRLYEDDQGNLWIGMFPAGVDFLDRSAFVFKNYTHRPDDPTSLSHNGVLTFFQDNAGHYWIGTERGVNRWDRENHRFVRASGALAPLADAAVLTIEQTRNGDFWFGTWSGGLYRYRPATDQLQHYLPDKAQPSSIGSVFIWKLLEDRDGTLWVGTENAGLSRYRPATDDFVHYTARGTQSEGLISNQIWTLLESQDGHIWIATLDGLDRLNKKTQTFEHFPADATDPDRLSSHQVISLYQDRAGDIWVGTRDGGVNRFDHARGTFERLSVEQGLPSSTVSSIIQDDAGDVWVTTVNGIARIDPEAFRVLNRYYRSDGLVASNFNRDATFKDDQGRLFVGSIGGFSVFDPAKLQTHQKAPPVVITELRLFNQPVSAGDDTGVLKKAINHTRELTLRHDHNMFSFEFAALSFRTPELNRYAYKLEGFDRDWNFIGHKHTATYTNMSPGEYVFRVKAADKEGNWNEQGAAIAVRVEPPPWRSGWAYFAYLLVLAALLYTGLRVKQLRQQSREYQTLSLTDPLTNANNRAGMARQVQQRVGQSLFDSSAGLLVIDIDHFKPINDSLGHDTGDRVLRELAALLAQTVRASDCLARWGGEEFVLFCAPVDTAALRSLAEKVRRRVESHVFDAPGHRLSLTLSIGGACARPGEDFDRLFKRADEALYNAKADGRNRAVMAQD